MWLYFRPVILIGEVTGVVGVVGFRVNFATVVPLPSVASVSDTSVTFSSWLTPALLGAVVPVMTSWSPVCQPVGWLDRVTVVAPAATEGTPTKLVTVEPARLTAPCVSRPRPNWSGSHDAFVVAGFQIAGAVELTAPSSANTTSAWI